MPTSALSALQSALAAHADPVKKAWWERYLRGAMPFRGVPMATIRREVAAWAPTEGQFDAALALLAEPLAEDKLAGILLLAEHVLPSGEPRGPDLLAALVPSFDAGWVADWNTCDWLSVKVLHGLLLREGPLLTPALASWSHGTTLWQRRAAVVAFVKLAPRGDANWAGFTDSLLAACAINALDTARFSQTSVGWALRELSKAEPARVQAFVSSHPLSKEAEKMALAKLRGRGPRG